MAKSAWKLFYSVLDPIDRISEVLFGLIMVLTSTGTLSVATAGRAEVKTMILAALGCNLAWGIIDAGLYLMGCLGERGRGLLRLRSFRNTTDPEAGQRTLVDALLHRSFPCCRATNWNRCGKGCSSCPSRGSAPARPRYKRRMAGCPGHLPACISFDHSGHHPIPVHRRAASGPPGFQRHRNRDVVHVRLCVRA